MVGQVVRGTEAKRHAPAAERNRQPIADVLAQLLPETGWVLEIASGTGQHAVHFARAFPALVWQPSDLEPDALASIEAWRAETGLANLQPPVQLDVRERAWSRRVPVANNRRPAAVFCANMIHIAPWRACEGLFQGSAQLLGRTGALILYGPYRFGGEFRAESNARFDQYLREQEPSWGVRDVSQLDELAGSCGLERSQLFEMPANNHIVVFRPRRVSE